MRGNVDVINQGQISSNNQCTQFDTVGVLMVPTQGIQTYLANLQKREFTIESIHDFKDPRGGQQGTEDEQILIVWSGDFSSLSGSGMNTGLSNILTELGDFSASLPYC
jgi:hypothetical protein